MDFNLVMLILTVTAVLLGLVAYIEFRTGKKIEQFVTGVRWRRKGRSLTLKDIDKIATGTGVHRRVARGNLGMKLIPCD
ncbi:MAG: hypothetical protein V3S26_00275 [Acidimicrobiia bacterium]